MYGPQLDDESKCVLELHTEYRKMLYLVGGIGLVNNLLYDESLNYCS